MFPGEFEYKPHKLMSTVEPTLVHTLFYIAVALGFMERHIARMNVIASNKS